MSQAEREELELEEIRKNQFKVKLLPTQNSIFWNFSDIFSEMEPAVADLFCLAAALASNVYE